MSIERVFYCDGPECEVHIRTIADFPSGGFIKTYERWPSAEEEHHFCSWDCVMKFAAGKPPMEIIPAAEAGS